MDSTGASAGATQNFLLLIGFWMEIEEVYLRGHPAPRQGCWEQINLKKAQRKFGGDNENMWFVNCGGGYIGLLIHQNSRNIKMCIHYCMLIIPQCSWPFNITDFPLFLRTSLRPPLPPKISCLAISAAEATLGRMNETCDI